MHEPINSEHLASLTDADVIDRNGDKVGSVGQIYLDDATGQPAWVSVKSGLFGLRESLVPLNDADVANGNIQVPYTKDQVKDSPRVDAEDHLDDSQQSTLFSYYGVDRAAAAGEEHSAGAPDRTSMFGSDETAEDMSSSRTEGVPTQEDPTGDDFRDGAVTSEYTTPGVDDLTDDTRVRDSGNDLGSGPLTDPATTSTSADAPVGGASGDRGASDDGDAVPGVYQQTTPAGAADWSAEQDPSAPTEQAWAIPASDPADEEPTDADRSGYAPDQPAAHSAAYERRDESAGVAPGSAADEQVGAAEPLTPGSAPDIGSTTGDYGELERLDEQSGTVGSSADTAGADHGVVSGAEPQTGTGYPQGDSDGLSAGAAVAGGAAPAGHAADVSTTAYETPGAETGDPITGSIPPAALAPDVEEPADGLTLPDDTQSAVTQADDTQSGDIADEESPRLAGTDAGGDDTDEPEAFGPEGYRPDRDGTDMSDEERERLNRARSAL